MSDLVAIEIIRAVASIAAALGAIAAAWFSYKASVHSKEAATASKETVENTNGMKTELVNLTRKSSYAQGKLEAVTGKTRRRRRVPKKKA